MPTPRPVLLCFAVAAVLLAASPGDCHVERTVPRMCRYFLVLLCVLGALVTLWCLIVCRLNLCHE